MNAWRNFLLTEIKARTAARQLTRIFMLMIRTVLLEEAQSGLVYDTARFKEKFESWKSDGKLVYLVAGIRGQILKDGLDKSPTLLKQWLKDGFPEALLAQLRLRLSLMPANEQEIRLKLKGEDVFYLVSGGAGEDVISISYRYDPSILKEKGLQQLPKLLAELDGVVYHELVHYLQFHNLLKSSGRDEGAKGNAIELVKQFQKQLDDGGNLDTTAYVAYMLQPAEIEGFARGFYLDSINLGVPWEQIIDNFLQDTLVARSESGDDFGGIKMTQRQISNFENELFNKVKPELINYAKKNLPCASMNNGRPVSTNCKKPSKLKKTSDKAIKKMKTMWGGAQGLLGKLKKKSPF